MKILVINPGSTSTKIAVYDMEKELFSKSIEHSKEELAPFKKISDQLEFRKETILNALKEAGFDLKEFACISARGGNIHPVPSGTYVVNEKMVQDMLSLKYGAHPSNLGAPIAYELSKQYSIPAFIVDPVVVDEMEMVNKITGLRGILRQAKDHPLNQKAVSREVAKFLGKKYEECNFIVAHLGGGISVAAHKKGKIVDVNNALNGDGPFSPERAGDLPNVAVVEMCFSGNYTKEEILKMLAGNGGFVSHLGTNSLKEVLLKIEQGDEYAKLVYDAMVLQIAKWIGIMAVVLKGFVDGIILTGGMAKSEKLVSDIKEYVGFIAPVYTVPGEFEMKALMEGALRVLKGEEEAKTYE
ncbi:butyrate kinase [Caldisericum exile]|uniref:Probable butyrate kinase n=1 Tax=Caldisericum exile (strain DSM 21853 / NBRC 104410 / AZM16c01) TaxID=511051 RepID=A0A7U6GDG0_CALEA|nr:butyrate kinase [Caldisericum exile]BAL80366.1 butyrate kinase [Caldisericum exile AZM16c01]